MRPLTLCLMALFVAFASCKQNDTTKTRPQTKTQPATLVASQEVQPEVPVEEIQPVEVELGDFKVKFADEDKK